MEKNISGYLDYSATTPVDGRVAQEMSESIALYANPSSNYSSAWHSRKLITRAREQLSGLLNTGPETLYFTSGGTEANNTALKGRALMFLDRPGHIVCSSIEHASVLETLAWCESALGFYVTYVEPAENGVVQAEDFLAAVMPETQIVTLMAVNNELGIRQPIAQIGEALRSRPDIFFHVDAVQGLGKMPLDLALLNVDSMSVSAHKIYGPKGIGALFLRHADAISPLLHGGGQERGVRGGTENIPGLSGFARALELIASEKEQDSIHLDQQKTLFINLMRKYFPQVRFNGSDCPFNSQNNIVSVTLPGYQGRDLLEQLDLHYGIRVSLGSACSSNKVGKTSHVLSAIGLSPDEAASTMRVSFGRFSCDRDVKKLVKGLLDITASLEATT